MKLHTLRDTIDAYHMPKFQAYILKDYVTIEDERNLKNGPYLLQYLTYRNVTDIKM